MLNKEEIEQSAKKHRDSLADWLKNAKQVVEVTPTIQQAYEIANYQYELISTMPKEVDLNVQEELMNSISGSYDFWKAQLPVIQPTSASVTASGLAMSVYDSTSAYDQLTLVAINGEDIAKNWATPRAAKYREIQDGQQRINAIIPLLSKIKIDLANEFQAAVKAYRAALPNVTEYQNAGIQLRNVLAHTKGELISKAMALSHKQKIKWFQMASILAKGGNASSEHSLLIIQDSSSKSLHDRLTIVAKNQSTIAKGDLEDMFTDFIDHLFTVLNLIDLSHF